MTKSKKNILYISNFGDVKGGGEVSLLSLIRELDRDIYEPHLVIPEPGNMEDKAAELDTDCTIVKIPSLRNPFLWGKFILEARKFSTSLNNRDVSLVHANTNTNKSIFVGLASRMARIPCVCHVRVLASDGIFDKAILMLFDKVITNSDTTAEKFKKYNGYENKILTVYNAVEMAEFNPGPALQNIRESMAAGPEDILVCNAGFLHEFKGQRYFIQAANILRDDNHIKFAIIGNGPMMDEYVNLTKELNVEHSVFFSGHRDDMADIMRAMDILVLSSSTEGFGRVLIEAMACGKPVIGIRAGGIREIIEEEKTGLMIPPNDPEAMASAIARLANNRNLRESMGAMGVKVAMEKFSSSSHMVAIMKIYDSLLLEKTPLA